MNINQHPLDYNSINSIKAFLEPLGFNPRKRWGQNYLINPHARTRMVEALELTPDETVWEIGPGLGAMTIELFDKAKEVVAFEIDPGYVGILHDFFDKTNKFTLIEGDVIKTWYEQLQKKAPDKVLGNLPYNAASAIIASFIEHEFFPKRFLITIQKEMADRMRAKVDTENYSSFSVLCQSAFKIKMLCDLKPASFFPKPGVNSSVAILEPHLEHPIDNKPLFFDFSRDMFNSRRKTLKNNIGMCRIAQKLGKDAVETVFIEHGIDLSRRAETLSVLEFIKLSNALNALLTLKQ